MEARKTESCGSDDQLSQQKMVDKVKAPVLWTIQWEEDVEN